MNAKSTNNLFKLNLALLTGLVAGAFNNASAQEMEMPAPPKEMEVLKKDVGEWNCEIKTWAAPDAEPEVTKGSESNRMLGGFWLLSEFKGKMMGMDFEGHGTYTYDPEKKKYIGSWRDSMSPTVMHTVADWNEKTNTLTAIGDAPGPDGNTWTHTMTTTYKGDDGSKVMTMYMQPEGSDDDQKMKFFEMTYTKK